MFKCESLIKLMDSFVHSGSMINITLIAKYMQNLKEAEG